MNHSRMTRVSTWHYGYQCERIGLTDCCEQPQSQRNQKGMLAGKGGDTEQQQQERPYVMSYEKIEGR